jgi:hypothetical protein
VTPTQQRGRTWKVAAVALARALCAHRGLFAQSDPGLLSKRLCVGGDDVLGIDERTLVVAAEVHYDNEILGVRLMPPTSESRAEIGVGGPSSPREAPHGPSRNARCQLDGAHRSAGCSGPYGGRFERRFKSDRPRFKALSRGAARASGLRGIRFRGSIRRGGNPRSRRRPTPACSARA